MQSDKYRLAQSCLTAREREALHWISEGKRDREIACIMGISPRTAQHHVSSILYKLGVETRTAAARISLNDYGEHFAQPK